MNRKVIIQLTVATIFVFTLISCKSPVNVEREKINTLEQELLDPMTFSVNHEKADELINAYKNYINKFPDDTMRREYIFKLAELSSSMGRHSEAIGELNRLIRDYPDWDKLPDVLFIKGFILEDKLMNIDEARKAYEDLIERFPEHPFSENARVIIDNLGIPADSLIQHFERQQAKLQEE